MFGRRKKAEQPSRRQSLREPRVSDASNGSQFRRNRTLSGIQRDSMVETGSARTKVHDLTRRRRHVGGIFLLVLAGCALLALLITQFTARVLVTGSSTALAVEVENQTYEKIINDYLGVHPTGRLRFALSEAELSSYATILAPEVESIAQTGSENVIDTHFSVTFRRPIAGWQINTHQYYVDDHGVVFEKNYYATPSVQIIDESGISPEQGTTVASNRLLSFVGRVVALSKDGGFEVEQAILPAGTTRQLEIKLKDTGPRVKLSIDRGAGEQVEDMIRALNFLSSRGQQAQYVDVRVSGRAVYL